MAKRQYIYFPPWSLPAFFAATLLLVHWLNSQAWFGAPSTIGAGGGERKASLDPLKNSALWWALLAVALLIPKTIFLAFWTVKVRIERNSFINPEDFDDGDPAVKPKTHDEGVERVRRAHMNDLENVVPGLIVFLALAIACPGDHMAGQVYPLGFVLMRYTHTALYLSGVAHFFRANAFSLGVLCVMGACDRIFQSLMQ